MNFQDLSHMELTRRSGSPNAPVIDASSKKQQHFPFVIPLVVICQLGVWELQSEWTWLSLCYDPCRRHELWRYMTVFLIHLSPAHFAGNLLFELIVGLPLERLQGGPRTGAIFLSGVMGGTLLISILVPKCYVVGASGGVYALLAAHVVQFIFNWTEMQKKTCRLYCLLACILFDATVAFVLPVIHAVHFGGAIGGFIAAVFMVSEETDKHISRQRGKTFKILVGCAGSILFCIVLIINTIVPTYYKQTELNFNYSQTFLNSEFNNSHPGNPVFWELLL